MAYPVASPKIEVKNKFYIFVSGALLTRKASLFPLIAISFEAAPRRPRASGERKY